jgi:hypothetical protein
LPPKNPNHRPESDEIEVSLFGPNYGESVILHVGDNAWIVVDSCQHPRTKKAAPLQYLQEIGVDPRQDVKLVVATHWHDDHIRGLGETFAACHCAAFACSVAQGRKEFLTLVQAMTSRSMIRSTGVAEFANVLAVLDERRSLNPIMARPRWAIEGRPMWQRVNSASGSHVDCAITALSPSDASVQAALQRIDMLMPQAGMTKRHLPSLTPNDTAVVLWVRVGTVSILLGSDLEQTAEAERGWSAVLMTAAAQNLGKASVFKVPHHGSATAENPSVWTHMLEDKPVATLSPFLRGGVQLPTRDDAGRICSRTNRAYCTADFRPLPSPRRPAMVNRTIRETVVRMRPAVSEIGQIRLRAKLNPSGAGAWGIDLFGKALPLDKLYAS